MYILLYPLIVVFEIIERLILRYPKLLPFVLSSSPSGLFFVISKIRSKFIPRYYYNRVPAYKKFINANGGASLLREFKLIPETTKTNYIHLYPLLDRCVHGLLPSSGNIDESAGSSGIATMWVRSVREEKKLQRLINFALQYTFRSFNKQDLVVLNCWSTGPWATGVKFSQLAQRSSVVKCIGTDKVNVINTLQTLGDSLEYVISGYPPFIKEIFDYGDSIGFEWEKYRIHIVTGGEGFSEGWRSYIRKKISSFNGGVYSAYGSSDIDIGISFETNFSIRIMELADKNLEFRKYFFGGDQMPAYLGQYNPMLYNIEQTQKGELLFTALNQDICSPKIRYNIKDSGGVKTYREVYKVLRKYSPDILKMNTKLKLPFIFVFGRSDGTISLDGANIYPNDIQDALFKSQYAHFIRSFFIEVGYTSDQSMVFNIMVELSEGKSKDEITSEEKKILEKNILDFLMQNNRDYNESYQNNPESLYPNVYFYDVGMGVFAYNQKKIKHIYYIRK